MGQAERSGETPRPAQADGQSTAQVPPPTRPTDRRRLSAAAALQQRQADRALVEKLAEQDWCGPAFQLLERRLIEIGTQVLTRWISRGEIYERCYLQGRPIVTDAAARAVLREDHDERASLVGEAVAQAWKRFRERALIGGGWLAEGGSSLASYFVGAVLLAFPAVHRRWYRERGVASREHLTEDWEALAATGPAAVQPAAAAADLAEATDVLVEVAPELTGERLRVLAAIFQGITEGLTYAEIGSKVGLSGEAVGMRVARFRSQLTEKKQGTENRQGPE
ncbi:hypothetical protein [Kitasatospora azatica]|uniref:hypothetical protein n=1 Tax=Kitasatospora azatica TaxID=58347 RepID=UPI00056D3EDA|nr:hypothetical protein [Kitasatospora azatica]